MTIQVSDYVSNVNEQLAHWAAVLQAGGRKMALFDAIYYGKRSIKTVRFLARRLGLSEKRVLDLGKGLVHEQLAEQVSADGRVAYKKIPQVHHNKRKILALARDRGKLKRLPTKRSPKIVAGVIRVDLPSKLVHAIQISIDDIESFSAVLKVPNAPENMIPERLPEKCIKEGFKRILHERGAFKDWGGERDDLYTTRVRIAGRRFPAAFAFKGPLRGPLVPGKMGKNGDQIQRLFLAPAEVFFVQYEGEIAESIVEQMQVFARAKSASTARPIRFGIIDQGDTYRLRTGYPKAFR